VLVGRVGTVTKYKKLFYDSFLMMFKFLIQKTFSTTKVFDAGKSFQFFVLQIIS